MSIFAPFALLALAMVVGSIAVGLASTGPLGLAAAVLFVAGVIAGLTWLVRRVRRWWRTAGAAARGTGAGGS